VGLLWGLEMGDTYSLDDLRAAWIAGRDAAAKLIDAQHRQLMIAKSRNPDDYASPQSQLAAAIRAMTLADDFGGPEVGAGNE